MIFNRKAQLLILLALFPIMIFAQGSEEKPKYAPGKEKHRNKTDELGRKQGQWMFFNTFGDKIAEIDFVNDQKEGVERKFFSYDKPREETEYLAGVKDGQYTKYFFSGQVNLEGAYKDGKKDASGDPYRKFGDLIVWKQIIAKAKDAVEQLEAAKKKADEEKKAAEKKAADKKGGTPVIPGAKPSTKPSTTPATTATPAKSEPKK